eukprot:gene1449-2789_t
MIDALLLTSLCVLLRYSNAVVYNLNHLTQSDDQNVCGPIQDDEALLLYAIIRNMRISSVFEIGGYQGDSARNFLKAMEKSPDPIMYTVDLHPVPVMGSNHRVILKFAADVTCHDLDNCKRPLGMIFFDCHNYDQQMHVFYMFLKFGAITNSTIIALHDTGVWPKQSIGGCKNGEKVPGVEGFVHRRQSERKMVNTFIDLGYHCLSLLPDIQIFTKGYNLAVRHGLSICQIDTRLKV